MDALGSVANNTIKGLGTAFLAVASQSALVGMPYPPTQIAPYVMMVLDFALFVQYDDTALPHLGVGNVQAAIDALKAMSPAAELREYIFGLGNMPLGGGTNYLPPGYALFASDGPCDFIVSKAFTATKMLVKHNAFQLGNNEHVQYTLRKNNANTGQTVALQFKDTGGSDAAHPIAFAAGDTIGIEIVSDGTISPVLRPQVTITNQ
jgi:hypothetical protein